MSDYVNPFPDDKDRAQIWEMLVERDIEAYLAADWSMVADDFVASEFFGINAGKNHNPSTWSIQFSVLDTYKKEWLTQAIASQKNTDTNTARKGIIAATSLRDIEIVGDRAIAHKKFNGEVELANGGKDRLYWQTLYICKQVDGRWKIASFVGYLPYNLGL